MGKAAWKHLRATFYSFSIAPNTRSYFLDNDTLNLCQQIMKRVALLCTKFSAFSSTPPYKMGANA